MNINVCFIWLNVEELCSFFGVNIFKVVFFNLLKKIMPSKMEVASQHWTDWTDWTVETIEINRKI